MTRRISAALLFAVFFAAACSREAVDTPEGQDTPVVSALTPEQRARVAALADTWPQEPSYRVAFNALDPEAASAGESVPSLFDPNDPHWGLPEDENRVLIESYCAACHSLQLVMQQHMDAASWDAVLTRMVAARGMPEMRPDVRQSVLIYLSQYFGPVDSP